VAVVDCSEFFRIIVFVIMHTAYFTSGTLSRAKTQNDSADDLMLACFLLLAESFMIMISFACIALQCVTGERKKTHLFVVVHTEQL